MSSHPLLHTLEQQLAQLAKTLESIADQPAAKARFDRALFATHGTRLRDYLNETRTNLEQLARAVAASHVPQTRFLAERIVAQMAALQREEATQALRRAEPAPNVSDGDLYQKLAQHQDYERRLKAMIADRESRFSHCVTLAQQQTLQREIATLEGRLGRCRQALGKIEKRIERYEQGT